LVALLNAKSSFWDLVHAVKEYRQIAEGKPLTLQGSNYAHALQKLNKAIDRAEGFLH
jgi:hypothetical protein